MRCTACGAELILANVVPETMVRGFERHTFICSAATSQRIEWCFTRHGREDDSEPVPVHERHPPCLHQKPRRSTLLLQAS